MEMLILPAVLLVLAVVLWIDARRWKARDPEGFAAAAEASKRNPGDW